MESVDYDSTQFAVVSTLDDCANSIGFDNQFTADVATLSAYLEMLDCDAEAEPSDQICAFDFAQTQIEDYGRSGAQSSMVLFTACGDALSDDYCSTTDYFDDNGLCSILKNRTEISKLKRFLTCF